MFDAAFGSEDAVRSALAVGYIEPELAADRDVWEVIIVGKARKWMSTQVDPQKVEGLIAKAKMVLKGEEIVRSGEFARMRRSCLIRAATSSG